MQISKIRLWKFKVKLINLKDDELQQQSNINIKDKWRAVWDQVMMDIVSYKDNVASSYADFKQV